MNAYLAGISEREQATHATICKIGEIIAATMNKEAPDDPPYSVKADRARPQFGEVSRPDGFGIALVLYYGDAKLEAWPLAPARPGSTHGGRRLGDYYIKDVETARVSVSRDPTAIARDLIRRVLAPSMQHWPAIRETVREEAEKLEAGRRMFDAFIAAGFTEQTWMSSRNESYFFVKSPDDDAVAISRFNGGVTICQHGGPTYGMHMAERPPEDMARDVLRILRLRRGSEA